MFKLNNAAIIPRPPMGIMVSRTDNTFIYVSADAQYKKEISGIIEDLGY